MTTPRPRLVPPSALGLVFVGGACGTLLRYLLEAALGAEPGEWPLVTMAINVLGSFLLGALTTVLARHRDPRRGQQLRWSLGTGAIGGFTTYSTFVLEVHHLALDGHVLVGAAYAVSSVLLGVAAAYLGVLLAGPLTARRRTEEEAA